MAEPDCPWSFFKHYFSSVRFFSMWPCRRMSEGIWEMFSHTDEALLVWWQEVLWLCQAYWIGFKFITHTHKSVGELIWICSFPNYKIHKNSYATVKLLFPQPQKHQIALSKKLLNASQIGKFLFFWIGLFTWTDSLQRIWFSGATYVREKGYFRRACLFTALSCYAATCWKK